MCTKFITTYTEVSPSGTGVKLWAKGSIPRSRHVGDAEIYNQQRFFTLTGHHLAGTPREVKYRPDALTAIYRELFPEPEPAATAGVERDGPISALELGDEDVIRLASQSPHNGERFRRLWDGDSGDYAVDGNDGESEADGALCEILAYYGGPDEDRIARLFERSGRMRDKWHRSDYRQRTIDLALRGKTRFYGDGVRPPVDPPAPNGTAAGTCEEHAAELARLQRLLIERDELIEVQQAIISRQRAELEDKTAFLSRVTDVLAKPNEEMSSTEKVVALVLANETHYRADRGRTKLPLVALAERTGLSENTVSRASRQIAERDGSPFERRVTREVKRHEDGGEYWISTVEFVPKAATTAETLVAIANLPAAPDKPKHGGSEAATTARWRCKDHPDAPLRTDTIRSCSVCGASDRRESLNHQLDDSDYASAVDVSVLKGHQPRDSAGTNGHHPNGVGTLTRPPALAAVWRCSSTRADGRPCGSFERALRADGSWRCHGCGAKPERCLRCRRPPAVAMGECAACLSRGT
jgi:hypothetical protein